ncbi:MAG: hypothetical protein JO359_03335 [Candidatus Eremiobacteraeota bacterium]|nr:hypothetical protein [Candidatus Eremiobacteraeota bacterium]
MENQINEKTELDNQDVPTISSDDEQQMRRAQGADVDESDEDERGNELLIGDGESG